jgi:histidyl-tRNA synthetase
MKDADRENARHVIIVGGNELAEGKFTLRNMKASEEDAYTFEEILNKLTN